VIAAGRRDGVEGRAEQGALFVEVLEKFLGAGMFHFKSPFYIPAF
jgi:hypothetical protein